MFVVMSPDTVSRVSDYANALRISIDREAHLGPLGVVQELRGLVGNLPLANLAEQLLARGFIAHHLARISRTFVRHPDIVAGLVSMTASPWAGDEWLVEFFRLADRIEAVLQQENQLGRGQRPLEVRISKALKFIETSYADSELTLRRLADEVGLSPSYLAHSLKRQTGDGFVGHLRRHRVRAAHRLLEDAACSVKEVAAATGYKTPRQLERDFKRLVGVAPTAVRHARTHWTVTAE